MKPATVKKRQPTDSTLRNVRAAQKRVSHLLERIRKLETRMAWVEKKQRAEAGA